MAESCRVLLVEDDPGDASLLRQTLSRADDSSYDIIWVSNLADARSQLLAHRIDVVLLDLSLPDSVGMDTVRAGCEAAGAVPLVVLTGHADTSFALKTLEAGAQDYLVKGDFDTDALVRAIRHAISRSRLEQQLLASMQFAQSTLDALTTQICVLDDSGAIISANKAWRASVATTADKHQLPSSDPGVRAKFATGLGEILAGTRGQFELEYPGTVSEEPCWWMVRISRFVGSGPVRVVVAHEDVTARRQAEAALRASEERLQLVLAGTNEGWWDWDLKTDQRHYSPRWWNMLGYAPGEFATDASSRRLLIHPDDVEGFDRIYQQALLSGLHSFEVEFRLLHKDGHFLPVLSRGHIVRDELGMPIRVSGANMDLTERKLAESSSRLAVLGTLAAGAAHEINNPLTFISANLGFVRDELAALRPAMAQAQIPTIDEMGEALEEAQGGAERIRTIVAGLRAFSRPASEAWVAVDVVHAVETAVHFAANDLRHRARVVSHFEDVRKVLASPHALEQVFLNLLVNASLAIPEGHAQDHVISLDVHPGALDEVLVEVRDSGIGMTPEVRARLFEPFFTTRFVGAGTGLGLSICHGIVTAIGGRIEVESSPGQGSLFRVVLPAMVEASIADKDAVAPSVRLPDNCRILVVDDDPHVAKALARALSGGPEIVIRHDARGALAWLATSGPVDLVVCDLMMPNMTGIEFQQALLADNPLLAEGMIFITGGAFTPQAAAFLASSPNLCLEKPFRPEHLRRLVAERLYGR